MQPKQWPLLKRLTPIMLFCLLAVNSCKKSNFNDDSAVIDPAVNATKEWYENTYPKLATANVSATTVQVDGRAYKKTDFSQLLKPNWQRGATYKRFNADVVEMPVILPTNTLHGLKHGEKNYDPKYIKTSFLMLKNEGIRSAYIMMLIADSAYLNNDTAKLARNTYRKRDSTFSGKVLYFTPKGDLVSSYNYKNGKLEKKESAIKTNKSSKLQVNTVDYDMEECTYYFYYTWDAQTGIVTSVTFLWKVCSSGGSGGSGNSGGGGGGDGTPIPCPPGVQSVNNRLVVNSIDGDENDDGDGGGGFPPPNPPPTSGGPCTVTVPPADTVVNVRDSCLKEMVRQVLTKNIAFTLKTKMNGLFSNSSDFHLKFVDNTIYNNNGSISYDIDGTTDVINATVNAHPNGQVDVLGMNILITLNGVTLPNSSEEYVTITILHEVLHAYFRTAHQSFDHFTMANKYIPWFEEIMLEIYPQIDPVDLRGLAYGGLMNNNPAFTMSPENAMKSVYEAINNRYKSGNAGKKCKP